MHRIIEQLNFELKRYDYITQNKMWRCFQFHFKAVKDAFSRAFRLWSTWRNTLPDLELTECSLFLTTAFSSILMDALRMAKLLHFKIVKCENWYFDTYFISKIMESVQHDFYFRAEKVLSIFFGAVVITNCFLSRILDEYCETKLQS
jgi:hypothetical protein